MATHSRTAITESFLLGAVRYAVGDPGNRSAFLRGLPRRMAAGARATTASVGNSSEHDFETAAYCDFA